MGSPATSVYRNGTQLFSTIGLYYTDSSPAAGTTPTYTVRAFDAAGNLGGSSNALTVAIPSSGSAPPPPPPPPPTTPPPPPNPTGAPANTRRAEITGTPAVGATLTASIGSWSGPTPMTYSYRWQRCSVTGSCMNIYGVLGTTYRPTLRDVGSRSW